MLLYRLEEQNLGQVSRFMVQLYFSLLSSGQERDSSVYLMKFNEWNSCKASAIMWAVVLDYHSPWWRNANRGTLCQTDHDPFNQTTESVWASDWIYGRDYFQWLESLFRIGKYLRLTHCCIWTTLTSCFHTFSKVCCLLTSGTLSGVQYRNSPTLTVLFYEILIFVLYYNISVEHMNQAAQSNLHSIFRETLWRFEVMFQCCPRTSQDFHLFISLESR